jgi:hypothetical protein
MDGFSLIVGAIFGVLVGWAFAAATAKQREATLKWEQASLATEEISKKKGEAKLNKENSLSNKLQGFLLYVLGCGMILVIGMILFASID